MAGAFDDLIPAGKPATAGAFDDLIPGAPAPPAPPSDGRRLWERASAGLAQAVGGTIQGAGEGLQSLLAAPLDLASTLREVATGVPLPNPVGAAAGDVGAFGADVADVGRELSRAASAGITRPDSLGAAFGDPANALRYYGGILSESAPLMLGAMATRNPTAATSLMGALTGGQTYGAERSEGASVAEAGEQAIAAGLLESLLGKAPFDTALSAGMPAVRRTALATAQEAGTEALTGGGQEALGAVLAGREVDPEAVRNATIDSLIVGAPLGAAEGLLGRGPSTAPAAPAESLAVPPATPPAGADLASVLASIPPETVADLAAALGVGANPQAPPSAGIPADLPPLRQNVPRQNPAELQRLETQEQSRSVAENPRGTPVTAEGSAGIKSLADALALDEDAYIAAVNPEGKRISPEDRVRVFASDLDTPPDAQPAGQFADSTGAPVELLRTPTGLFAQVDGKTVGSIELEDGETLNTVAEDFQGRGIGTLLAREFIRENPLAPSGGFSEAGEATRRKAFRQLREEAANAAPAAVPLPSVPTGRDAVPAPAAAPGAADTALTPLPSTPVSANAAATTPPTEPTNARLPRETLPDQRAAGLSQDLAGQPAGLPERAPGEAPQGEAEGAPEAQGARAGNIAARTPGGQALSERNRAIFDRAGELAQRTLDRRQQQTPDGPRRRAGDAQAARAPDPRATGTKNAARDRERQERGADPILRAAAKSNETTLAEGQAALDENPAFAREVVEKLNTQGTPSISPREEAALLVEKVRLRKARDAAADRAADPQASEEARAVATREWEALEGQLNEIDQATSASGREWGRFGQFRQRMLREDFTFEALERKERVREGRPLTAEESASLRAFADRVKVLEDRVSDTERQLQEAAAREGVTLTYKKLVEDMAKAMPKRQSAATLRKNAAESLKALRGGVGSRPRDGMGRFEAFPIGMADSDVERTIRPLVRDWRGDAPAVRVVQDADALPEAAKFGRDWQTVEGWYDGRGTVWLVASNLRDKNRALEVLAHEAFGHYGVEGVLGREGWQRMLDDVGRLRARREDLKPELRAALDDTMQRYGDADPITFARELLAVMAERGVKAGIIDRVLAAVRDFLRRLGFPVERWADATLRTLVADGARRVQRAGASPNMARERGAAASRPAGDPVPAEAFRGMTRAEFLGSPKITSNANAADLKPSGKSLEDADAVPFASKVGELTAKYTEQGAAVFDGDKVIASYSFGDTLVVDKTYRRSGIGAELVYQWRTRYPAPAKATTRTKASQALQEKVWARIQRELLQSATGNLYSRPAVDPIEFFHLSRIGALPIAEGVTDREAWMQRMRADLGDEIFTRVESALPDVFDAASLQAQGANERAIDPENVRHADVYALARKAVNDGVRGEAAVMQRVTADLTELGADLTERDVRRLFSEYGKVVFPSKEADKVLLRELRSLVQMQESIDRITEGLDALKSGPQRDKQTQLVREKRRALNDMLKQHAKTYRNDPEKLATFQQARVRNLQNQIEDLEKQIATGERPKRAKSPEPTPEIQALIAQRDQLRRERDLIDNPRATPDERYQRTQAKNIARQLADVQARLAAGDYERRPRVPKELNEANTAAKVALQKIKAEFARRQFEAEMAKRPLVRRIFAGVGEGLNLSRAYLTSLDFSGLLRQGGFITLGHPVRAAQAVPQMLRAFASEGGALNAREEIAARPNAALYKKHKLELTTDDPGTSITKMEEQFASRWLERVPNWALGGLVRGSSRAYSTVLNRIRADAFDAMAAALSRSKVPTKEEGDAIANYINVATGRGWIGRSNLGAQGLNTVFFAPRLVASRFNLLAFQPLYGGTPRTRAMILAEYARFLMGVSVVFALAHLAADEDDDEPLVTLDPRSSNFAKIKFNNTYIDPLAGLAQVTTFLSRVTTGETVTGAGEVKPLRNTYRLSDFYADEPLPEVAFGDDDTFDVMARFARTKFAPVPSAVTTALAGENVIGEPATPGDTVVSLVVPIGFQDVFDLMRDNELPKAAGTFLLSLLGFGVQYRKPNLATMQNRLKDVASEELPEEVARLRERYPDAFEGRDLDTYADNPQNRRLGRAGEPKRDPLGRPRFDKPDE